jgi:hypothetical protein
VSIAIDVDDGKRRKYDAAGLEACVRNLSPRRAGVGLMFHHALYNRAQTDLSDIASRLAACGRFSLLSAYP